MEDNTSSFTPTATTPNTPGSSPAHMTYKNTLAKIGIAFAVLLAMFPVGWALPHLALITLFAAMAVGLVFIHKKKTVPALVLTYAVLEGYTLGALSGLLENHQPGVVLPAVLATMSIIAVVLGAYQIPAVRAFAASHKVLRVMVFAVAGYMLFSLINLGLMLTGVVDDAWGLHSAVTVAGIPLGLILGVLGVLFGAYSLTLDFNDIEVGVAQRWPEIEGWRPACDVIASIVWIYVEVLRFISILKN